MTKVASRRSSWFAPFEGVCNPYPIAVFRIAFFAGLALHFFPALIHLDDAFAPGSLRTQEWNHWLFIHFWRIPHGVLRAASIVTMLACVLALVGLRPRVAAIVGGAGCYLFASFNGLHLQTLAIVNAWAILLLWMICGGGSAVLSVDALLRGASPRPPQPKLLPRLVLYQALLAVFFSGVEKLLAGWPASNEMGIVLAYPKGFLVRDWVWSTAWLHGPGITRVLSWFTVLVEIGTPIGLLFRRTRLISFVAYQVFFLGIIAMLEVPPLFYGMFAFGVLPALDDALLDRIAARLRRARGVS